MLRLCHEGFAGFAVAALEVGPPVGEFLWQFARGTAQREEVVAGAEARRLQQPIRHAARALLKARLHAPDFLHVGGEAPLDGELLGLTVEHFIHGGVQRGDQRLAGSAAAVPVFDHVMPQQGGKQEARRDRLASLDAIVGVVERKLHEALAHRLLQCDVQQRQQAAMQARLAQLLQRRPGVARHQQLQHLVEQAGGRHVVDQRAQLRDRRARVRVDVEAGLGCEAHHAQHAHRVFAVAGVRIADHAQRAGAHVFHAVMVVMHGFVGGVVIHRVDGEVAAGGVFGLGAPDVVAQHTAAGVDGVRVVVQLGALDALAGGHLLGVNRVDERAEGRDFDDFLIASAVERDVHDLEAAPDDARAAEQRLDLIGRGVGRHIEVFRLDAEQQVAHGTAHDEGGVAASCSVDVTLTALRESSFGSIPCSSTLHTRAWRGTPPAEALVRALAAFGALGARVFLAAVAPGSAGA